jgi:hypothetical protein
MSCHSIRPIVGCRLSAQLRETATECPLTSPGDHPVRGRCNGRRDGRDTGSRVPLVWHALTEGKGVAKHAVPADSSLGVRTCPALPTGTSGATGAWRARADCREVPVEQA